MFLYTFWKENYWNKFNVRMKERKFDEGNPNWEKNRLMSNRLYFFSSFYDKVQCTIFLKWGICISNTLPLILILSNNSSKMSSASKNMKFFPLMKILQKLPLSKISSLILCVYKVNIASHSFLSNELNFDINLFHRLNQLGFCGLVFNWYLTCNCSCIAFLICW